MKVHDMIEFSLASMSPGLANLASISRMNNVRLHELGEE